MRPSLSNTVWCVARPLRAPITRAMAGESSTLERTEAVFLEAALRESAYRGAVLFPDIDARLQEHRFSLTRLGLDAWNYGGNALWVRDLDRRR